MFLLHEGFVLVVGLFLGGRPVELFLLTNGGGLAARACVGNARRVCKDVRAFCGGLIVERVRLSDLIYFGVDRG